jgi:hypothetical protein
MTLRRTVLLSDLHLGGNPALDDFTHDAEFAALLALPELQPEAGTEVTLVLLGDTFDLWQAVSPQECAADEAVQVVLGDTRFRGPALRGDLRPARRLVPGPGRFTRRPQC